MMNDVCDRDIDAVHPERPAPRGVLEPHSVLAESLLIYLLAPALSLAVGLAAFVMAASEFR
jgi:4-hydroxybenzoate polyprenyltransferase